MKPTKDIEQLYQEYIGNGQFGIDFEKKHIIEFAVAFHKEKLREELMNYCFDYDIPEEERKRGAKCWQFSVFVPISINNVKRLMYAYLRNI